MKRRNFTLLLGWELQYVHVLTLKKWVFLVGDVAVPVALHERRQFGHVWNMRVSIHDLLHHALREECAQLAPQALPLLTGRALGPREAALRPQVPGQAVGLSVGVQTEVLLLWKMRRMVPVIRKQSRAGAPCWAVGGHPALWVTTPALGAHMVLAGHRAIRRRVVTSSTQTGPLVVPSIRPWEGAFVVAQAVAGHPAAVAVGGPIVDVEPGHAVQGAEGLVHIRARAVTEARVGLHSWAAGVSLKDELLAGWHPMGLVLYAEGRGGGWGVSVVRLIHGRAAVCVLQARFRGEGLGFVSQCPQFISDR